MAGAVADRTPPTGTIKINGGAGYTREIWITLALSATDPEGRVVSMSFSSDGRRWTEEVPFAAEYRYQLPAGDGPKTVQARFRDQAGLYSAPVSASIILDTAAPIISGIAVKAGKRTAELTWRTNEPAWCEVRYGPQSKHPDQRAQEKGGRESGGFGLEHRLVLEDLRPGTYYFVISASDQAGNAASSAEGRFETEKENPPGQGPGTPSPGPSPVKPGTNMAAAANGGRASGAEPWSRISSPGAAIDGNLLTYWLIAPMPASGKTEAYWQVDLARICKLASLRLSIINPDQFSVEYRQGGKWVKACEINKDNAGKFGREQAGGLWQFEFKLGAEADAIRLVWKNPPRAETRLLEVQALAA